MKSQPLFFIHIPKTAGTSFRVAMESSFGRDFVVADYGPKASETHRVVKEFFHDLNSPYEVLSYLETLPSSNIALTGHVPISRYAGLFPCHQIVTFIRRPLDRIKSEYQHRVRLHKYEKSFNDFIRNRHSIDLQQRYLSGITLSALGFVGLTEDYEFAIDMINEAYSLELPKLVLNTAPSQNTCDELVSEEDTLLFNELNKKDICLYEHLFEAYQIRKNTFSEGKTFTHGDFCIKDFSQIFGFAFQKKNNTILKLVVEVEDKVIAEIEAKEFYGDIAALGVPRKGYVGFSCKLEKKVRHNHDVKVRVESTGQYLKQRLIF